ncbi:hypothetical protein OQY15_17700 [Pedobacter sp. MC2016-15]|uniref:hypothetical protein n=1 Tax=Pedobacter sp. MC2016-15 TaxID=2994473 RepID=UPI0022462CF7|nr:hypothetical protein [Pedobacter sp. MC2016-15]MCX2480944.1 hypothetical protein [Pedobacter sp. MC2016-15]
MITPEDNSSFNEEEQDEQFSQQDVQSDGIDAIPPSEEDKAASDVENLTQADRASESSFTLNVDNGIAPGKPDRK